MGQTLICVKINDQDRELIERLSKHYTISKTDVLKVALKDFAERHGVKA